MTEIAVLTLGGLAFVLLAMRMMTDGLKLFAGGATQRAMGVWTSSPLRGVLAGILLTGAVQSSSAVTVATIGFVNAGALTLSQALGVIYGANVGTTVTGWLVSLVGIDFRIEALALPLVTLGIFLTFLRFDRRISGLGEAVAGFGMFFLGLMFLKSGLSGFESTLGLGLPGGARQWLPAYLLFGFVFTVLVQSSSAAIAVILTSAGSGLIGLEAAAAGMIGAGLGTTSTAALASIGATPNARRSALGHVVFNVIAGSVGLIMLVPLLGLIQQGGILSGVAPGPVATLAIFHTAMKLTGLAVVMPLTPYLTRWLSRRFRSDLEQASQLRFLDDNVLTTPGLAVSALKRELARFHEQVRALSSQSLTRAVKMKRTSEEAAALAVLGSSIRRFANRLDMAELSKEVAGTLAVFLRIERYLTEAVSLVVQVEGIASEAGRLGDQRAQGSIESMLGIAHHLLARGGQGAAQSADAPDVLAGQYLGEFDAAYHAAKRALLEAGAARRVDVNGLDMMLTMLSRCRRMVEQVVKARAYLDYFRVEGGPDTLQPEPVAADHLDE
jgi:phosphate:Na+ symporter